MPSAAGSPRATAGDWIARLLLAAVAIGLVGTLLGSAWDYGGAYRSPQSWSAWVVIGLIPLGLLAIALHRPLRRRPTAVVWLSGLAVLATAAQCLPLPDSWTAVLSPASYEAYHRWIPDGAVEQLVEADVAVETPLLSGRTPISVDTSYTRMAIAGPAIFGLSCWLASLCFVDRRVAMGIFVVLAIAGAIMAFFGLTEFILIHGGGGVRHRWMMAPDGASDPFGPFVNNNNAAGFLNLTLGCGLGLLAYCVGLPHRTDAADKQAKSWRFSDATALLSQWRVAGSFMLVAVMAAGILGSQSRGGSLGMIAGGIVLTISMLRRMPTRRLIIMLVTIAIAALAIIEVLGIRARTQYRLQTITEGQAIDDPRLPHWGDGLAAAWEYLPAGSGLGTYRFAHLPYQTSGNGLWFHFADGMHVEWALEGGVWLLSLVVLAGVSLMRDLRRLTVAIDWMPADQRRVAGAVMTAGIFVFPAALVSGCFDYGLVLRPLHLTLAIVAGAVGYWGTIARRQLVQPVEQPRSIGMRALTPIVSFVLLATMTGGLAQAAALLKASSIAEVAEIKRRSHQKTAPTMIPSYEPEIRVLEGLTHRYPSLTDVHLTLSRLLIDEQRRLGAIDLQRHNLASGRDLAMMVSAFTVRRAFYLDEAGLGLPIEQLMLPSQDLRRWQQARNEALAALVLCPLDDIPRRLMVPLDMVQPAADRLTPQLLEQAALLRWRSDDALLELQVLSDVHPNAESSETIRRLRQKLRAEK